MAKQTFRIDGLRELDRALGELPKATARNTLRRVLLKNAEPLAIDMASRATVVTGALAESFDYGTKLTRRQASLHKKIDAPTFAEVFVGSRGDPAAIAEEFGNEDQDPHPSARPAWDAGKDALLDGIKRDLWTEVEKSAKRNAKKLAKAAAKAAG